MPPSGAGSFQARVSTTRGDGWAKQPTYSWFLAAAAHDMKNPLMLIKGFAQVARRQARRLGSPAPETLMEALCFRPVIGQALPLLGLPATP